MFVVLFEKPSEALYCSWLDLVKTVIQSCKIEPDPAAGCFGIGFALGHIPLHSAVTSEKSPDKLPHPPHIPLKEQPYLLSSVLI